MSGNIDTQISDLLTQNAAIFAAYEQWSNGQVMLLAGTVDDPTSFDKDGGKTGALGYYPVVNVNGQTLFIPCIARLNALAAGSSDPAMLENLLSVSVTQASNAAALSEDSANQALTHSADASNAAIVAAAASNYRATLAEGVSTVALGQYFASAQTGTLRIYKRVAADPGYQDQADVAAPVTVTAIPLYRSRAAVQAMVVPTNVSRFDTAGYAMPGDRGNATFVRVAVEPSHPGKLPDAAGAWFEQQGPEWRPQQFGGFTSSANATAAFTAADACARLLGGFVNLIGVWRIADFVQTCSLIAGQGRLLTRVMRAAVAADGSAIQSVSNAVWSLAGGAVGMTVQDMTFDGTSAADPKSLLSLGAFTSDITVQRCGFENGMNRWALRGDPTTPFQRLNIVDNYFNNCPQGGIIVLCQPGSRGARTARINRNTFNLVGSNICSIRGAAGADGLRWNGVIDVEGNDNVITNCSPTGTDGPIPFEFWGCSKGQHMRNKIDSGTRGLGMGAEMQNFEIAFNDVSNQTAYAIEGGTCRNVYIHHNTARNCRTFCPIPSSNETDKLVFEDNTLIGTALTSYNVSNPPDVLFVGGYARGLRIRRMVIRNPEYCRTGIYLALSKPVPTFTVNGGGTGAALTATLKAVRVRLRTLNGGSGYTNPVVTLEGGGGTGMAISATMANGVLTGATITNVGTGYTSMPTAIVTDPTGTGGELEIMMGIEAVTSTGGIGYVGSTWSANGNGVVSGGAAGTFSTNNGVPGSFVVTNPGEGFGRVSDAIVDGCEITGDTYLSCPAGISVSGNVLIRNPIVRRSAPYDANHYFAQTGGAAVQITPPVHANASGNPYGIVENPICEMTGALSGGVAFMAIAAYGSAQPMIGLELRGGGKVSGNYNSGPGAIFLPDNSGSSKIGFLDTTGVVGTTYNLNAAVLRRRTKIVIEGSAPPTVGTFFAGDMMENSAPSASSPLRWVCVAGGTPGIWAAQYGTGSDPIMSGYQTLSTYTASPRLMVVGNPTTNVLKIRSEAVPGNGAASGQVSATLRVLWSGRLNNAPKGGQVFIALGSYDKSDAAPSTAQIGDAVTIATAVDGTGRLEITITFPVSAAPWLILEGVSNNVTTWARISAQVS